MYNLHNANYMLWSKSKRKRIERKDGQKMTEKRRQKYHPGRTSYGVRETSRRGFLSTGVTGDWEQREQRYTSLWPQPIKIAFVNLKALWHPSWGFMISCCSAEASLFPVRMSLLSVYPCIKKRKSKSSRWCSFPRRCSAGLEWRLHSWTRPLIHCLTQTKGIITHLLFASCLYY